MLPKISAEPAIFVIETEKTKLQMLKEKFNISSKLVGVTVMFAKMGFEFGIQSEACNVKQDLVCGSIGSLCVSLSP